MLGFPRPRWLRPSATFEGPRHSAARVRFSPSAAGRPSAHSSASARGHLAAGDVRCPPGSWERVAAGAAAKRSLAGLSPRLGRSFSWNRDSAAGLDVPHDAGPELFSTNRLERLFAGRYHLRFANALPSASRFESPPLHQEVGASDGRFRLPGVLRSFNGLAGAPAVCGEHLPAGSPLDGQIPY